MIQSVLAGHRPRADAPRFVSDVMSADPIVVRSDAPIEVAASLIAEHRVSRLPVVGPTDRVVGVISEVDLMRVHGVEHLWANRGALLVRHLMSAPAVTVHGATPLALAARRMERHRLRRLVVVADDDDLKPIGIVSAGDLARTFAKGLHDA